MAELTKQPAPGASGDAGPAATPGEVVVRMAGVRKSFLGNEVLKGVDLELRRGEVHALVGENGAGKSTLMKILAGVHRADAGSVEVEGREVHFDHPLQAQAAGISTVFQEFNLLPERSVAENVFLGREPRRRGLVDGARMVRETTAIMDDLGVGGFSPRTRVGSLSVAQQQVVEIVKALSQQARIISMDEPTAALSDAEVEMLYGVVRTLSARGVAILYVSHRLREIFDLCDRVTVLKDGALVTTSDIGDLTTDSLVRAMVGRSISAFFPDKPEGTTVGDVRLEIRGGGNLQLDGVDLQVRAGEIVGLAGLQGSGRTEIAHALFGIEPFTRGQVLVDGTPVRLRSARAAVRAKLALVTEDRKAQGLALRQSILANARVVLDAVLPGSSAKAARRVPNVLSSLELTSRGLGQQVRYLSGGNQQKVVLAKWLVTDPAVMLLDEPTRGIDVGAKRAVYELMRELAHQGVAQLVISSELPELIGMADRIVVLHEGRVAGELPAGAGEEDIMHLATGSHP